MVARKRSSAVSPMVAVRASSSAISAWDDVAIPRGAPVEPEVSLMKAASGETRAALAEG